MEKVLKWGVAVVLIIVLALVGIGLWQGTKGAQQATMIEIRDGVKDLKNLPQDVGREVGKEVRQALNEARRPAVAERAGSSAVEVTEADSTVRPNQEYRLSLKPVAKSRSAIKSKPAEVLAKPVKVEKKSEITVHHDGRIDVYHHQADVPAPSPAPAAEPMAPSPAEPPPSMMPSSFRSSGDCGVYTQQMVGWQVVMPPQQQVYVRYSPPCLRSVAIRPRGHWRW